LHLAIGQARIVSRIALLLARDGGSAPRVGIKRILPENAEKQGALVSNSRVLVKPP
jgi:hypothetical protein